MNTDGKILIKILANQIEMITYRKPVGFIPGVQGCLNIQNIDQHHINRMKEIKHNHLN